MSLEFLWFISPRAIENFLLDNNNGFGWHPIEDPPEHKYPLSSPVYLMGASQIQVTMHLPTRVAVMVQMMDDVLKPASRGSYTYTMLQARNLIQKCRDRGFVALANELVYSYEKANAKHTLL